MDWDWEPDEDETHTAYHEAGHAIVGCALGAQIDRVSLSQASAYDDLDDGLPSRFGDCLVNWGRVDPNQAWQQQRELLTILAGPIAELIYRAEDADQIDLAAWELDWQQAQQCVRQMHAQREMQNRILRDAVSRLKQLIGNPPVWPAVAALADELAIGDEIDGERVAELVRFWWRRAGY
ncbi:M41 family metallopeptidase [Aporhodopirellula aestuarii]|uniref:Cell division protein FtsH n=1 Tax=Aporhodopirellula aestuarii TaxID=2950107 RepID=A0ABT0UAZ0_9BACT|nr:cell division protein FtsH [Aporhodopirellula aestuarii]MCM2374070.1 cell division protein FtsH [Aporhodopirellula aestuarii]